MRKLSIPVFFILSLSSVLGQGTRDLVNGNLIQFNDNGAWCWFQDERAVIDTAKNKLIIGSAASAGGVGGSPRNAMNEAVIYDLPSGTPQRYTLWNAGGADDHNAPGFLIRPDGKYLTMYAKHYDNLTRYRTFDGASWSSERQFDWATKPGGIDYTIAYNNVYYLSAEGRVYDFSRANHRAPNFLVSNDLGETWTWGGQLTTNASNTYNKGYYKYWSNGIDRIDFIFTEQHPRDTTTSIYHGYIKGGKSYDSYGNAADNDIFDSLFIPSFSSFTKIFAEGTVINGDTMRRCWNADVQNYGDGTIAAIITCRANNNTQGNDVNINPDHRFIYCRFDGTHWSYTQLGKAGPKMYSSEADYTGLGALCPNDPNTLYISTTFDPRNNTDLTVREIFKGATTDHGATWSWTPITQNSSKDNFRPIVPAWDDNHTALLWWRGTYSSAQIFNAAIVGIIDSRTDTVSTMTYVDANPVNTTLTTGGAADSSWHVRSGSGNGGTVYASSDVAGENLPVLKTGVSAPVTGTYDVWVNFWGCTNTSADWRIKAGLSADQMRIFRSVSSKQVDVAAHAGSVTLTGSGNTYLYQAYLGRIQRTAGSTFDVFVDDEAVKTGQTGPLTGDVVRTWYDGVSFALVNNPATAPIFASSAQGINFGTAPVATSMKDSVFISNAGNAWLMITSILSTNTRFAVSNISMSLPPSGGAYVAVTFTPLDTTEQSGFIVFSSNAPDSPETLYVGGKGLYKSAPGFVLSKSLIDFHSVSIEHTMKDSVGISNDGLDTLSVTSIVSTNERFSPDRTKLTVPPGLTAYLKIFFVPLDTTAQTGFIVMTHTAASSPDTLSVRGDGIVPAGIGNMAATIPTEYSLAQNYPNPFNPSTGIRFALPSTSTVSLMIYDVLGKEVAVLADGRYSAGYHDVIWNASSSASGVYIAKLTASSGAGAHVFTSVKKLLLVK